MQQLQPFEWAILVGCAAMLFFPFGKLQPLLASLRGKMTKQADPDVNVGDGESELHAKFQAFNDVRNAVSKDPKAVEALDRLVLPVIVTGTADPHYGVTWSGDQDAKPAEVKQP